MERFFKITDSEIEGILLADNSDDDEDLQLDDEDVGFLENDVDLIDEEVVIEAPARESTVAIKISK